MKRPSSYSKPWWTLELTQLRRIYHHTSRLLRKNLTSPTLARVARNTYFKTIQSAKRVHWSRLWPMLTCDRSGMPERLRSAEPLICSPHSRTPPPQLKLTIHFYNICSLLDPLLLLPSSFQSLRTSLQFYHQECPPHSESSPTRQPLAQVVFLTLSGSKSTRPTSRSFPLCSLLSSPTGTTL